MDWYKQKLLILYKNSMMKTGMQKHKINQKSYQQWMTIKIYNQLKKFKMNKSNNIIKYNNNLKMKMISYKKDKFQKIN